MVNYKLILKFSIVLYLVQYNTKLIAQNESQTWVIGEQRQNIDSLTPDTGTNLMFGANIINFKTSPFILTRYAKSLSMDRLCLSYCDTNGNLLFYGNGSKIFNSEHRLIDNADRLNYNQSVWGTDTGYYSEHLYGRHPASGMVIKNPKKNSSLYYFVHVYWDWDSYVLNKNPFNKIVYSVLDMSANNGKGKLIIKEQILINGSLSDNISACKKANGRDWWLYVAERGNTNSFVKLELDSLGIRVHPQRESIGWMHDSISDYDWASARFSPNGKKFAFFTSKGLEVFDFNRCMGTFSNRKYIKYPFNDTAFLINIYHARQVCFSPNSRYLYINFPNRIYQIDVDAVDIESSIVRVATWDWFYVQNFFATDFMSPQLAPDGKIYYSTSESTIYLHIIEYPDRKGSACEFKQRSIRLNTFNLGVPYYPFYGLGADSSSCWGSGIDIAEKEEISVYPNPVGDRLSLKRSGLDKIDYKIYDLVGKKQLTGQTREDIDVSVLSEGLYLLHISTRDRYIVQKFEVKR
jgi:hypothetical protein